MKGGFGTWEGSVDTCEKREKGCWVWADTMDSWFLGSRLWPFAYDWWMESLSLSLSTSLSLLIIIN